MGQSGYTVLPALSLGRSRAAGDMLEGWIYYEWNARHDMACLVFEIFTVVDSIVDTVVSISIILATVVNARYLGDAAATVQSIGRSPVSQAASIVILPICIVVASSSL